MPKYLNADLSSDKCFTLDLNLQDPVWETMAAPMTRPESFNNFARMSPGGLVPYKDKDGGIMLFAMYVHMCRTANNQDKGRGNQ